MLTIFYPQPCEEGWGLEVPKSDHPQLSLSVGNRRSREICLYEGKCAENGLWDGGKGHLIIYQMCYYCEENRMGSEKAI